MTAATTWVELPYSKYGIQYVLDRTLEEPYKKRLPLRAINSLGIRSRRVKKPIQKSPFVAILDRVNAVTHRWQHPDGTAIMYIREIFEPGDPEFDFIGAEVNASQLSSEQVARLRIMILPERREEFLVAYLNYYDMANNESHIFTESTDVLRHFGGFKRRYWSTKSLKEKFDLLFGFSFAVKKYSAWMYRYESRRAREKMVAALARHWRHLLWKHSPEQLGLDNEFSYPALLSFLRSFKRQAESIETFGDPPIKFVFEAEEKHVSFDEEASVSTVTMSVNSRFSL
jgi:hypothetical protein